MKNKRNKYLWYYVAATLVVLYISFFYMERTEISDVDVVRVLGIDYKDGEYTLTALYNQNGGADEATSGVILIEGSGASVYEAYKIREMCPLPIPRTICLVMLLQKMEF